MSILIEREVYFGNFSEQQVGWLYISTLGISVGFHSVNCNYINYNC